MKKTRYAAIVAVALLGSVPHAESEPSGIVTGGHIAANGNAKGVAACVACHGAKGEGQAATGIPRLAGLNKVYLAAQLVAFSGGQRENAVMSPIAKTMDAEAMEDAAAYYASLVPAPAAAQHQPSTQIAMGRPIALRGDWNAKIPPCASCHGANGLGVGAAFPSIAGQSSTYFVNQLQAWKSGTRHDDPLAIMRTVARRLDDTQIAAVSVYYETMAPAAMPVAKDPSP